MICEDIHKRISRFCNEVLFSPSHTFLGIQAVFLSNSESKPCVVLHVEEGAIFIDLEKIASVYFRLWQYTIVQQKKKPMLSISINVGSGIRHPNVLGWGTLGGIFTRKDDSNIYGLSNNHVVANRNNAQQGDVILYDGNIPIGKLYNWFTLRPPPQTNFIDAALVKIDPKHLAKWNLPRPVSGKWKEPQKNMKVVKNGFATGETEGVILSVGGFGKVSVGGENFHFSGIIEIEGIKEYFSTDGDSGSIVLSHPDRYMIGIIFAKHGDRSWALPISKIKPLLG